MLSFSFVLACFAISAIAAPASEPKEFEWSTFIGFNISALPTAWWDNHGHEKAHTSWRTHHHASESGSISVTAPSFTATSSPLAPIVSSSATDPPLAPTPSSSVAVTPSVPIPSMNTSFSTVSIPSPVNSSSLFPIPTVSSPVTSSLSTPTLSSSLTISSNASSSSSATEASASSTPSLSTSDAAYLYPHNALRAQHSAPPLAWSADLAAAAQTWASKCDWAHSGGAVGSYGENIAAGTGDFNATSAVAAWASEESQYNASNPVYSHYTQMVWKSTTELGCAVASCPGLINSDVAQLHVCEYNPAGNVQGEFPENVS